MISLEAYLDNAATTKMRKSSILAVSEAMEMFYGNPSSIHGIGRKAEDVLESARKKIFRLNQIIKTEMIDAPPKSGKNNFGKPFSDDLNIFFP